MPPHPCDPESVRRWALAVFADVWRTTPDRPGYAVLTAADPQPTSKELRRAMMDIVAAFNELSPVAFVPERVGRFDQQVSTRFHRDGAPNASLLILAYEPTTIASKLFVHDPFRAADPNGTAFEYLQRHKPMTKEGDAELMRTAVSVLPDGGRSVLVVLNNSAVPESPQPGRPLGLLHKGLIEFPDPNVRRVINSLGLMQDGESAREPVPAERLEWFLHGDATD